MIRLYENIFSIKIKKDKEIKDKFTSYWEYMIEVLKF